MVRRLTVAVTGVAMLALVAFSADGQQIASAPNVTPGQRYLVFMEGGGRIPTSAATTLENAAAAAKSQSVTIEGRPSQAAEVKRELIRKGAPSESLIVRSSVAPVIPTTSDALPNPTQRYVAIDF